MSEFIKSKSAQILLAVLGAFILVIASFTAGVSVGERKARYFSKWSENYPRMFGARGARGGMMGGVMPSGKLPGSHGAFGDVLSVSDAGLVVQGKDGVEQNIIVTSSTEIRAGRGRSALGDIEPGDEVGVFGAPNDEGQIEARLIRLMK